MTAPLRHPASYRDPSGYVFEQEGRFYRFVHESYAADYDLLMQSGLYQQLADKAQMLPHEDVTRSFPTQEGCYKILLPAQLGFWTYPYEWSFEQLKAAALLTLQLNIAALQQKLILKDATAYNIQFLNGKPILIDTLSFERYEEGKPWQAFKQFCEHFLYPLLLYKYSGFTPALLSAYPDGIPAGIIKGILPFKSKLSLNNWLYVFLPASVSNRKNKSEKQFHIPLSRVLQNLQQLQSFIKSLSLQKKSEWNDYYQETILSDKYLQHKKQVVEEWLQPLNTTTTVDIGCNTGEFSLIAAKYSRQVVSMDTDQLCIDRLFRKAAKDAKNIQPIVADICNPSATAGWDNNERKALMKRVSGDTVLALALIHHLALAKNVSLEMMLQTFAGITTKYLVIEFVPKSDPRATFLLQSKKDIYDQYTLEHFEAVIKIHFKTLRSVGLDGSERVLYLLEKI